LIPSNYQLTWAQARLKEAQEIGKPMQEDDTIEGVIETLGILDEPSGEIENRYDECEAKYGELALAIMKVRSSLTSDYRVKAYGTKRPFTEKKCVSICEGRA
jgi:hypothetical protein